MATLACPAVIYQNASIVRQGPSIYFVSDGYPEVSTFYRSWSRDELGLHIHERLGLRVTQRISKIIYRLPMGNTSGGVIATAMKVRTDADVAVMFEAYDRAAAYFQYLEIMVEVVDTHSGGEHHQAGGSGASGAGPSTEMHVTNVTCTDERQTTHDHEPIQAGAQITTSELDATYTEDQPCAEDPYQNATEEMFNTGDQAGK